MKIENIQRHFQDIGKPVEQNVVYGYVEPKFLTYALIGPFSALKFKYYILGFFPDEIVFSALTMGGKFAGEHFSISKNEIESMTVKKGLIQYKVVIRSDGNKIPIKCNKFIAGSPWQKENTAYLESMNWYQ